MKNETLRKIILPKWSSQFIEYYDGSSKHSIESLHVDRSDITVGPSDDSSDSALYVHFTERRLSFLRGIIVLKSSGAVSTSCANATRRNSP